jgi:lantibiotic modifying enzyme
MAHSSWLYLLDELPMNSRLKSDRNYITNDESQIPFCQIWEYISQKVWAEISNTPGCEYLSSAAIDSLRLCLVERLSYNCSMPLWEFFQSNRLIRFPYSITTNHEHGVEAYEWFNTFLFQGGLKLFYMNHNTSWIRTSIVLTSWKSSTLKFLDDLHRDIDTLRTEFHISGDMKIKNLTVGMSDFHNGGKSVLALEIDGASQTTFIYKPKNIGSENLFRKILSNIGEFNVPWHFKEIISLDCGDHGWVESVLFKCAEKERDIEIFYKKAGVVLCLAYIFKLTDLHAENIIAQGDTPCVIDMEAMFHPLLVSTDSPFTVLDTGLIPPSLSTYIDIYGLTARGGEDSGMLHCKWESVGKDDIHPNFITGTYRKCSNLPILDGQQISATQYIDHICEGFNITYNALRHDLIRLVNIVKKSLEVRLFEIRIIPRSTMQYALILRNLAIYYNQDEDSSKRYIHQALDECTYYSGIFSPEFRQAEVEAIERLDIPCFRIKVNSNEILENNKIITSTIEKDIVGKILNTLTEMSEEDKQKQLEFITYSLSHLGGGRQIK